MGRNVVETIVGALVLVVAGVFVFYAFAKSDRGGPDGYEIIARFGRIDGLKRGADVTAERREGRHGHRLRSRPQDLSGGGAHGGVVDVSLPIDTNAKIVERIAARRHGRRARAGRRQDDDPSRAARSHKTQDAISFTELIAKFMFSGTGSK